MANRRAQSRRDDVAGEDRDAESGRGEVTGGGDLTGLDRPAGREARARRQRGSALTVRGRARTKTSRGPRAARARHRPTPRRTASSRARRCAYSPSVSIVPGKRSRERSNAGRSTPNATEVTVATSISPGRPSPRFCDGRAAGAMAVHRRTPPSPKRCFGSSMPTPLFRAAHANLARLNERPASRGNRVARARSLRRSKGLGPPSLRRDLITPANGAGLVLRHELDRRHNRTVLVLAESSWLTGSAPVATRGKSRRPSRHRLSSSCEPVASVGGERCHSRRRPGPCLRTGWVSTGRQPLLRFVPGESQRAGHPESCSPIWCGSDRRVCPNALQRLLGD